MPVRATARSRAALIVVAVIGEAGQTLRGMWVFVSGIDHW
jgi:hypothetical protein